ncbi:phosphate ABC transporter substrate-binding protein PstS [Thermofilum pendens]|uniref:Phosphate-binding protein n=1 Tax=Thermofilum pendens (strain DSM 2475 / Hrk 5) TaxID=368408 RepID=A1RZ28_THEPD|nr:phosphate ABC transporter substrate-binding protein PstS [Thermofilum pendens]ABL78458.1 phosphate ABC transporter, periplasmic phosphate-binding protein [Thermofilum pendens Hrk 5]
MPLTSRGAALTVLLVGLALAAVLWIGSQQAQREVLLKGSGATFPMPQIQAWAYRFTSKHPGIKIEYAGVGSGQGISDFLNGIVDFAGSDVPLNDQQYSAARSRFGEVYQLPYILGGVAVVYNVPEIKGAGNLRLTGEVLADILLGKIAYWDDPRIRELNPGLNLPHKEIVLVYRSDASGTNEVFTKYLSYVSPEWRKTVGAGKTVQWPLAGLGRAVGAKGNPGVAQAVNSTPYALGYVELAYTKGLGVAAIRNKSGNFVLPTPRSVTIAASALPALDPSSSIAGVNYLEAIFGNPDPDAYPISTPTFLVVKGPKNYDPPKAKALALFLKYIATEGQSPESIVEGYAPVPQQLREAILRVAAILEAGG